MKAASPKIVRYAVVGLGHIAQNAMLPAFRNARRNSRLTALVSDDPRKLRTLSKKYGVKSTFSYDDYDRCLDGVDAVYLALPNDMHAEFTIRAANAGVHVLCEKPMAVTVEDCERMIEACSEARVKLMIAYRLHFEELNLEAIDLVKRGRIGEPKFFVGSFSMRVKPDNIRANSTSDGGGTLYDIGVYCINAARYLFRAEPKEVMAIAVNSVPKRLPQIDESTGALLRFEGERVASFVTSFNADDTGTYRLVGTKGQIELDPAYTYSDGLARKLTTGGRTNRKQVARRDQFAPQLLYFSDCILKNREPEPSGLEGMQDVRIVRALIESADTGKAVQIPPYEPAKRPALHQKIVKKRVTRPSLVNASSGHT